MQRRKVTDAQILAIVEEGEAGRKVADLCRTHGITQQTYYRWKAKYGGMELREMQRLKQVDAGYPGAQGGGHKKRVSPTARCEAVGWSDARRQCAEGLSGHRAESRHMARSAPFGSAEYRAARSSPSARHRTAPLRLSTLAYPGRPGRRARESPTAISPVSRRGPPGAAALFARTGIEVGCRSIFAEF